MLVTTEFRFSLTSILLWNGNYICLVTSILQNIMISVQQKKEMHTETQVDILKNVHNYNFVVPSTYFH